ncbi:MAG: RDD family protein [Burkholderiaceae bacterium]
MKTDVGERPAGLPLRISAMVYDAVLLFGVVFVVSFALLAVLGWTYPLPDARRWVLQAVLFLAIGGYFVACWSRTGQTLALKSWKLRLIGPGAAPPSVSRAVARYVLAWHLFLPGALILLLWPMSAAVAGVVLLVSWMAMLLPALIDPERRLLHDRWTSTRVIRI